MDSWGLSTRPSSPRAWSARSGRCSRSCLPGGEACPRSGWGMISAMDILDPIGDTAATARTLAPRPASLQGAVIGVLDNSKPNARVLLEGVARVLAAKLGARDVRVWRKPGASVGAT